MERKYKLIIENNPENIGLVRLNTAFIASRIDFDIEAIEDIKVSISEAVNYQLNLSKTTEIEFILTEDKLDIYVKNDRLVDKKCDDEPNKFAKMILETLMDEVIFEEDKIFLSKNIKG